MEWTNDDALELIEQYRSHTELWNRADPKYKDKLCRFRAWSEIAERFGCSKAEVERKMNVLLTQYRREKHKMLVKLYQGIQPNPSKWYAFKRFDFMEAGGGSSANLLATSSGILPNTTSSPPVTIVGTNGHQHASPAAPFNGLTSNFGDPTRLATSSSGTSSQHRRIKSKELKYFGAMGLNLPMLLASSQTLDSWSNPVSSQFSPPARSADRSSIATSTTTTTQSSSTMHLPLPAMSAFPSSTATTSNNLQELSVGSRSLFGGSSNNSEPNASPHKTMDICDENNKDEEAATKSDRLPSPVADHTAANNSHTPMRDVAGLSGAAVGGSEANISTSPIPNQINTNEAHLQHAHNITPSSLRQMPAHHAHPPYKTSRQSNERDELEIKQELVDYFHPHAPVNSAILPVGDSQRSYSSADEMRTCAEDYAQDLRVAAAKGMNFGSFVLPRNLRPPRSSSPTESLEEKYTPLNMRKLNTQHSGANVLINSLLSNESMSEDMSHNTPTTGGRLQRTASQENSSAAAAAALYAESFSNRDDCDFVGSNVTLKLRAMDRTQRIIAEKLISEVLFYGQFNELERSARIQPK